MGASRFEYETSDDRQDVDVGGVAAALGRKKRLIAGVTFASAAAALAFCFAVPPRFMAESRILVENQESYFTRSDPDGARLADAPQTLDTEAVNSQIQLLTSRDLARKAVQVLALRGNPEFDPAASGKGLLSPLIALGLLSDSSRQSLEDRMLTKFSDHLTVMSPTKTRVLQVEFSSRDPDLAAKGANAVADIYMDLQTQAKRENAHQAAQVLKPLVAALEARVAEADAKVEAFRAEKGLFESKENVTVPSQQLGEIATKLAEARAAQSEAQAKAGGLRDLLRRGRLADAGEISSNDLVRRISDQRVLASSQLAAESRTLLPAHPRIKELQAQLADIDMQLRVAVEKAARGLDNDARVASVRVANLTALMDEMKHAAGVSGAEEAQLRELQRDDKTLRDQLASEAAKYQAALARDSADTPPPDARIISRALSPSQPIFPKKIPITIFAALAGLFFSAGAVAMREMTAARGPARPAPAPPRPASAPSREMDDFPAATRSPESDPVATAPSGAAGSLPRLKQALADFAAPAEPLEDKTPLETSSEAPSEASDAAPEAPLAATGGEEEKSSGAEPVAASRRLIERIAGAAKKGGANVLIASAEDSAPACISLTLARSLSREGRAILLQTDDDAFLREALEVASGGACDGSHPGLTHLLSGEASFSETIYRDDASRLHIVQAGGPVDPRSSDLSLILDALQATYDFVLIAAGADAAARSLAADSDLTLIFAEDRRTRHVLQEDFEASGARPIVLAGVDRSGEIVEIAA